MHAAHFICDIESCLDNPWAYLATRLDKPRMDLHTEKEGRYEVSAQECLEIQGLSRLCAILCMLIYLFKCNQINLFDIFKLISDFDEAHIHWWECLRHLADCQSGFNLRTIIWDELGQCSHL
jgi:hypothetical protein